MNVPMPKDAADRAERIAHPRRWALAILALFLALAVSYSLVVPPFETPDEVHHYAFARHLSQGNGLPVLSADSSGPWEHEGGQPPLYYAIVAGLTSWIDQSDVARLAARNPRANIGDPLFPGNKNFTLYSGADHPLTGSNLALHIGRWFSALLGVWTLWSVYLLARLTFPNSDIRPLLTLALAASIPQFAFISGALTNDALIIALSAATLYWLARLLAREKTIAIRWWEWLLLGTLLGLALLSKLQAVGLAAMAGAATVTIAWLRRDWRILLTALLLTLLPALLIAGWWYARNLMLYGDWSGASAIFSLSGQRSEPLDLADWWLEFRGVRYSFWGLFGWFNILLPQWFYWLVDGVALIALLGAAVALIRGAAPAAPAPTGARRVLWLATAWATLSFGLMVGLMARATASQGRLLFPALGAFAVLTTLGLEFWLRWLPSWMRKAVWGALMGLLVGSSIYALMALLPGSYRPDPPIAALPASATPIGLRYGEEGALKLMGIDIAAGPFRPGDNVAVTLYVQTGQPLTQDYQVFVQLLDENGVEVANVTTHPGWGRNPTSLWQPGAIYADTYPVKITGEVDSRSPLLARVYVGFMDPATSETTRLPLPARNSAGERVLPVVGEVTIYPRRRPEMAEANATPVDARFGDAIILAGAAIPASAAAGETITATLWFAALDTPAVDYTAFVHVIDDEGKQVAGFDREPAGGRYPTRVWRAGDRIVADFPITLPPDLTAGQYQLWGGLYESESAGATRLPVTDANGRDKGDGQVLLGAVRVTSTSH